MEEKENKKLYGISNMAKDYAINTTMDIHERIIQVINGHYKENNNALSVILMEMTLYKSLVNSINNMMGHHDRFVPDRQGFNYLGLEVIEAKIEGIRVY
jgi:hypothetical protein